ncbi:MAG: rubrerythrin [candidate division WOR-3 bacterium]|nr:rubrerythrin [candidate division WOR-3 bacterium]MCR4424414.1 rubrerythrin [candidate division WOR-3 bacterium]MDH7518232.1 ferritin family protein [bacterium]
MLSRIPIDIDEVKKERLDLEILRAAMIAELDAINLYEQMAAMVEDETIRRVLMDVAREEKTHLGEFEALLLKFDKEQQEELKAGEEEVEELMED